MNEMAAAPVDFQAFETTADLGRWLGVNHSTAKELWIRIFNKGSGMPSVTWNDCVVEAIVWGWIDSHKRPLDGVSFLQRLGPRKPKSNWSRKNRDHADRLIQEGRMTPAGQAHIDAAKADGRWEAAYAGSSAMTIPADFMAALEDLPDAKAFFETLDAKNLYPIYYRLHTARRPETRARRMRTILAQLARRERFH